MEIFNSWKFENLELDKNICRSWNAEHEEDVASQMLHNTYQHVPNSEKETTRVDKIPSNLSSIVKIAKFETAHQIT